MTRRNSIICPTPDIAPKKGLEKRRMSIADISLAKKKLTKSVSETRRGSVAPPTRRASIAVMAVPTTRRASFAGFSSATRRPSVPGISSDLQGIVEGEHFVDEAELFDNTPSGSGKKSKSRRRSGVIDEREEEREKVVEPSAEEKKEAFRNFLSETLKSVFDLIMVNDKINITIDNVFPLMKTLELDTKDEAILDMVRTSCIETFGDIDEVEFDTAVVELRKRTVGDEFEDDMRSAFNLIDYDEDGFITTSDIYQLMMGLGEMLTDYELDDLLKAADKDRDGKISYKDFKLFLVGEWTDEDEIREKGIEIAEEEENEEEKNEESTGTENTEEKKENEEASDKTEDKIEKEGEKEEEKSEEKPEPEVKRPSPKQRNSLLWGYVNKEEEEEQNDAMAQYLKQLEAKEKGNKQEEKDEDNKKSDEKVDDSKEVKEEDDKQEPTSEEGKDVSETPVDDTKEEGDTGKIKCEGEDDSKPTEENDSTLPENQSELKPVEEIENESKLPANADNDAKPSDDVNEDDGTDDARSVISVTVKHLDSILEEGEEDQVHSPLPVSRPQSIRKSQLIRQSSSASLRMRPSSALTESSIDVFGDDSGIDFVDGDDIKNEEVFDNFDDEGVFSRESSARDRVTPAKSHTLISQTSNICESISEAPRDGFWEEEVPNEGQRSVSTQLNVYASDPVIKEIIKTKAHRLHLCTENNGSIGPYFGRREDDQESDISMEKAKVKVGTERKAKDSSVKQLHVQNLVVDHSYYEAGIEDLDTDRMEYGSIMDYCSSLSSPQPTYRVQSSKNYKPKIHPHRPLLRTTSADRFKTIKQLENRILRHQNTDPQLSKRSILKANAKVNTPGRQNPNGLRCTHIDLDLGLGDELDAGQNFRPYSPLRRPRTAVTFKEARRRGMPKSTQDEYTKYDSGIDSPESDDDKGVNIVDLSEKLNSQFGSLEAPNQPLKHHGYKSVWPLARVMTAYNNKYNEGKSMQLNSISRRLERREIPVSWNERENPNIKFRERPQAVREPLKLMVSSRPQTAKPTASVFRGRQRPSTANAAVRTSPARPQTACSARAARPSAHAQPVMLDHSSVKQSNGGIINLSLPFQTDSKTRYKRMSHLNNNEPKRTLMC
ncbi:uncharacterized protein [Argopecten irradians]|uniref:uncharacterized protein n=1 Tax=Argopecten irradians TaxID=31199 RepID=UPI00371647AB